MAQATLHRVALNRPANRATHYEADLGWRLDAGRGRVLRLRKEIDDEVATASTPTGTDGAGKLAGAAQAMRGGQHGRAADCQAESRARPLARRVERMLRPARVRMRNRKPCVLARRRLFGW
jgi:hypothetical protein